MRDLSAQEVRLRRRVRERGVSRFGRSRRQRTSWISLRRQCEEPFFLIQGLAPLLIRARPSSQGPWVNAHIGIPKTPRPSHHKAAGSCRSAHAVGGLLDEQVASTSSARGRPRRRFTGVSACGSIRTAASRRAYLARIPLKRFGTPEEWPARCLIRVAGLGVHRDLRATG